VTTIICIEKSSDYRKNFDTIYFPDKTQPDASELRIVQQVFSTCAPHLVLLSDSDASYLDASGSDVSGCGISVPPASWGSRLANTRKPHDVTAVVSANTPAVLALERTPCDRGRPTQLGVESATDPRDESTVVSKAASYQPAPASEFQHSTAS